MRLLLRTLKGVAWYGAQILGYEIQQYHARRAKAYALTHRDPRGAVTTRKVKR